MTMYEVLLENLLNRFEYNERTKKWKLNSDLTQEEKNAFDEAVKIYREEQRQRS